jgi:hypothetical protein
VTSPAIRPIAIDSSGNPGMFVVDEVEAALVGTLVVVNVLKSG